MELLEAPNYDLVGIRANNPGPFTLGGTNSWVVGRDPAWLIDPGPALDPHVEAVRKEIGRRGGLGGIALTHDHHDHTEALPALRALFPDAPTAAGPGKVTVEFRLSDGDRFGPLCAVRTPGHSADHLAYVWEHAGFTGDAVLGEGSVFVWPYPGALSQYLEGLERLRARPLGLLCPGHGPLIDDPQAKLEQYVSHRLERERRLIEALTDGNRSVEGLLDRAWHDVPAQLRPAAAWTLAAHLDKLEQEGRLPDGVERPELNLPGGDGPAP